MISWLKIGAPALLSLAAVLLVQRAQVPPSEQRLWRHRNLGKAFYENPATQVQAVEEFRKALELAPDSARERLNYGLALLRAGKTAAGIAELERVQKQDPSLPHTWFNLGIAYKRAGQSQRAIEQFRRMIELAPGEAVGHYNLGVLHRGLKQSETAVKYFEAAARLDANLAAPHFQLYSLYRQLGRGEDAARELQVFQDIKKRQEGAAAPEDAEWSYYAEILERIEPRRPPAEPAAVSFRARRLAGHFDPATAGLAVIDTDGDGRPDLLAWSSAGLRLYRGGSQPVSDSGLGAAGTVLAAVPGDFDNDGLIDLCLLLENGPQLFANRKTRFERHAAAFPARRFEHAVWLDYDHDYDLDLFLLGSDPALYRNTGGGRFSPADFPFVKGNGIAGLAFRLIADSKGMDLAVSYADRAGVIYRDRLAGNYEPAGAPELPAGARPLTAYDFDNDGEIDLLWNSGIILNRRGRLEPGTLTRAGGALADVGNRGAAELVAPELSDAVGWAAADFDADGRVDLAGVDREGSLHLLTNATESKNNWLRVAVTGVKNLKTAHGAEIEVKAGALYQKKLYEGVPVLFGLAGEQVVDAVRITWPNGLIQNETQIPARRQVSYQEAQRLSGSCPMIFTWNGREFQFLTDVLGVAPLGASAGDGRQFPVDHDEYVQIPAEALVPLDGKYEIRITEELREVSYLDQVRLIAVDHPAAIEIFTNDKFKSPPFPDFRLFGVSRRLRPRAARDHRGRDVLHKILAHDRTYPDTFERDYAGAAEMHSLELDFGSAAADNRAVLILRGWVGWADGSTFRALSQGGGPGLVLPYLQVKDRDGRWRTVIEDMGIPAGKPKAMVVDLAGKFLSPSREVRIVTNLCVYWDEIFLAENASDSPVRRSALDTATAVLRFRGFSRPIVHPRRTQPESFDYSQVSATSMWDPTPGMYTAYGDVRRHLESVDDHLVIMGSGDELKLVFDPWGLPPLPNAWRRDFLLFVDGWAKDGDLNTAFSQTVEPLPFHGMTQYGQPHPGPSGHSTRPATRPALRLLAPLR